MDVKKIENLSKKSFRNAYMCMQCVNIIVLWDKFDFSEKKVKDITFEFAKYDKQDNETGIAVLWGSILKSEYDFDCCRFAIKMPYLQKVKLALIPKNIHDQIRRNHMILNVEQAVYTYFSVMMWTLKEFCKFGKEEFEIYMDGFVDVCRLFSKGMTLEFLMNFITNKDDEKGIGWEFEKCKNSGECCKKMNQMA